jgi:hypothetical protein
LPTYYEVLGIAPDASAAAIRRAYVELARRHHPDYHQGGAPSERAANERAMQTVNEAWSVLSDPDRRREYDGTIGAERRAAQRAADEAARRAWRPYDDNDDDIDPRLLEDDPANIVVTPRRQILIVLPTLSFGLGVVLVAVGAVTRITPLIALGGAAILVSIVLFVVLPLFQLAASARNDRR